MTRQHGLLFFFAVVCLSAALPAVAGSAPATVETFKSCHGCPEMVLIPAGSFTMGAAPAELARIQAAGGMRPSRSPAGPQHKVHIKRFAAGRHAVTRGEFAAFVKATRYKTDDEKSEDGCVNSDGLYKGTNWREPGNVQADDHPVVCVNWHDAQAYATWLSQETGQPYRLPSEAEREYTARAGSRTAYWFGEKINTRQANINNNPAMNGSPIDPQSSTVPVNSFEPNAFGLYNVHGNVWEWVADCFHDRYTGAPVDGSAWTRDCTSQDRVLRGGAWVAGPLKASSAYRVSSGESQSSSAIGFRVAMTLAP